MLHVKVFVFNPVQQNTYILYNNAGKAIIVDPGCYFTAEQEKLKQFLTDNSLTPVQLLNTHCHLDHVFGNKWVHETFGLELYLHPNEELVLQYAPISGEKWGLPFVNYTGALHFLHDGDVITLDEDELKVLLTPGHSPGSICFYNEDQNFVIGGDVLFYESIGRTDLPGGNHATLLSSIQQKLMVLPNETVVYNGHGQSTTIEHEKLHNPFLQ
ncbi:MAG: MBL fold metallo-hydrolase [Chitinophagaceae bacterium]|jgi:hydroxyacylglutathione hydrolase|nr:MBL fold metallo-hydrolase [Chitinophagaceae bacterium]